MSGADDMMALLREADEVGGGLNLGLVRDMKKMITSPAVGGRQKKPVRMAENRMLATNPDLRASRFQQKAAQHQLTPEKPISRELVRNWREVTKELAEEDNAER